MKMDSEICVIVAAMLIVCCLFDVNLILFLFDVFVVEFWTHDCPEFACRVCDLPRPRQIDLCFARVLTSSESCEMIG